MADLNINKTEALKAHEDMGSNLIGNGDFEYAPSFVAPTTTGTRWIDGTAGGSTTNASYGWASQVAGTCAFQFDSSEFHSGSNSMKVSTTAVSSNAICSILTTNSAAITQTYGIAASPSSAYKLTGWFKTNYVSGDSNDGAYMQITERTATGSAVTNSVTTKVKTTTDWTFYTKSFTTNASTVYLDIRLVVTGNTGTATLVMDAWFDDVILIKIVPDGNTQLQVSSIVTPGIQDINGPKIWS